MHLLAESCETHSNSTLVLSMRLPRPSLLQTFQAPAEVGATCDSCLEDKRPCSWTPDWLELLCNHCADGPRQIVEEWFGLRGYGTFPWAKSCDCDPKKL